MLSPALEVIVVPFKFMLSTSSAVGVPTCVSPVAFVTVLCSSVAII